MTLIGCWRFMGMPTHNGVVTVGNNETTPLLPDSLLGGFTTRSGSRISEATTCASNGGATAWNVDKRGYVLSRFFASGIGLMLGVHC